MGFLTRLLAGLTAAAALGAGLTGTANAVDVTGADGNTKSVVKLTADDTNNLPDHIVNGSFDYPSVPSWTGLAGSSSNKNNKGKRFATINPGTGKYGSGCAMSTTGKAIPNWNRSSFAWNSTQGDAHYPGMSCEAGNVELNYDSVHHNQFVELTADQQGTAIYQDVKVTPGTMMTWSLKHSSATSAYVDKMQVMIGEPYKETAQEATRIASENGNKVGEKMTTISTPTTSDRADNKKWDTYSGTYLVPDGVTTVRLTFKSVASAEWYSGNDLDDIEFSRSYKLTYDKNSADASGQVPSNQRGKENTTQPAKTKTSGTVKTVADTNASLPDHLVNGDFNVNYKDQWLTGGWNWTDITPDGKYLNSTRNWNDSDAVWKNINGWDRNAFGWTSTQKDGTDNIQHKAGAVELQYDDSTADNVYAELCAYEAGTAIYQDIRTTPGTLYKVRLKHASLNQSYLDKMQVMIGAPGHEQPVEMTRTSVNGHGDKLNEKSTTIATKVTNGNNRHHADQWETYEGTYLIPDGQTATRFTFRSVDSKQLDYGSVLDGIVFDKAYRLSYDKNSNEAAGSVPSNQRGKENTTQPAKTKTNGTVKTVADTNASLPDHLVNGDFEYPGVNVLSKNRYDEKDYNWWGVSRKDKMVYDPSHEIQWVSLPSTFDSDRFAWDSTEVAGTQNGSSQWHTNEVELQRDSHTGNMYGELCAYQAHTSVRQYIRTTPGVLYKVRLKHASLSRDYLDKMQVLVGPAGNEQPVSMTRVESQNGLDATGQSTTSTTVSTHASNEMEIKDGQGTPYSSRNHDGQWATYEGVYVATSDVTSFTFKSVDAKAFNLGNLLDDIVFDKAYKLTYDANSSDASGQVPSDTTANTVKQAKAKTSGTVKTVADDDSSKSLTVNPGFDVPDYSKLDGGGLHWMYVNPSEGNAWSYYDYINPSAPKHQVAGLSQATFGWQELTGGDHKTTSFELHREKDGNVCADVHGSRTIGQTIDTQAGVAYTVSIRHSGRSKGNAGSVQVLVGPDKDHLQPLEMSRMNVSRTGAKYGDKTGKVGTVITTHSDSVDSTEGDHPAWDHSDDWETYSGTYVATGGKTVFAYRGVDENGDSVSGNDPVADSVIDDLSFKLAYRLSYDKNAADAAGSIPSDEYGKENTVRQAKSKANGSVKLVADDDVAEYAANGLPKQIMNGDFDHDWRNIVGQSRMSAKYNFANIDPAHGDVEISGALNGKGEASKQWVHLNGFDASRFGWKSNQTDTRVDGRGGIVEIQRSRANDNMYAEITASQADTYLYQDIDTAHDYPTVYTVKLRYAHRNGTINSNEKIQILVGAPGHEQPVEMTRIASDRGNRLGEKSTTVNAPNTDGWLGSWDTFQGSVVVPAGQNVSRFTFKALGSIDGISGNLIDDVQFKLAYKLSYDKNANDASGSVPSDETVNTVKQAKAKTTGTVRAVADRTASGLTVHDLKKGDIAPAQYGDFKFSTTDRFTAEQVTDVNDFTVKQNWDPTKEDQAYADKNLATMYQPDKNGASLILHHVGQWRDSSGTQRWLNAKITVNGQNLGSLVYYESQHKFLASYGKWDRHTSSRPYMDVTVDFLLDDGSTPQGLRGVTGFTDLDGGTSGYNEGVELVSGFDGAYVRSDAHLARFGTNGWAGATDENENNADAHGMKHYVGATFTGSSFRVRWSVASGQARGSGFQPVDSTIAYRLTYNKNAQDATGSIPSDTAANTTQPAKSETDGKVSDLVQRTTTHEDGSVTVKTIDTSTDVVSGCQVYYPAGQKITLATMAKDDDCWDSSMLSRPGHTQLGWNQDRNATQAQAQVTMVEGGMTVYAVWVGNPVLTYDTNKPSTWTGEMPFTPASVSVAYNTAAADGSGWRAGDVSKIRGYRFLGWYTGPQDNAGLYDWTRPLTGSVTVYAHWQRLQANVVYDANGGTGSHANTTGWQYSDVTIPGDTSKSFTRTGYRFSGWNTSKDGKGTAYADGSKVPLQDRGVTLYAQWKPLFDVLPSAGGDYGPSVPWLVCGGLALVALAGGVESTLLRLRRARGAHSR